MTPNSLYMHIHFLIIHLSQIRLTLSPSSTSQILTPVAGLIVGNFFPLIDVCHSLLIKIYNKNSGSN